MADLTGEGYAALFMAGILSKQEIRDAIGFGPSLTADGDPAEPAPMPGTTAAPAQFVPQRVIAPQQGPAPVCPQHGTSHYIPAGISKKPGGRPYGAFHGCTEQGCKWRVDAV